VFGVLAFALNAVQLQKIVVLSTAGFLLDIVWTQKRDLDWLKRSFTQPGGRPLESK